ncbi:group II intron maturase-specific domain-containing protein [Jeotgalicoccus sp. S0W5]|uniref:group II intron maturase-specific domain-containing protein n=1 Tax=Jeotgalicoccus sp. S0W5 TaxID=2527874 RepID=UPI001F0F32F0|nr:group II intron maturase-specific domain-containing protein [Jeotgalicoccus sp. S0W5]
MKFLGFGFYKAPQPKQYQAKPHKQSVENFEFELRQLTLKNWSVSTKYQVKRTNQLIRGWVNYFKIGKMKGVLSKIDSHTRVRLRMYIWKKWKTAENRKGNLIKLGMSPYNSHRNSQTSKGPMRIAESWVMTTTVRNQKPARFGLISGETHYNKVHV